MCVTLYNFLRILHAFQESVICEKIIIVLARFLTICTCILASLDSSLDSQIETSCYVNELERNLI